MFTRFTLLLILFLVTASGAAWSAEGEEIRFSGDKTGLTDAFDMEGPWLLDWSVRGKSKLSCNFAIWGDDEAAGQPCNFEIRLVDVKSGGHVGTIAQLEGTGRGYKLFEEPGRYRIDVVAQNVIWEFLITEVDEQRATELKTWTEKGLPLEARSTVISRRVPEGSFHSWRPVDDETLLLFTKDEASGYRVTFSPACPGLSDAKALSFVTVFDSGVESYDSIMLDNGTRCYFNRVVPTEFS
jgi:hypothetical protein